MSSRRSVVASLVAVLAALFSIALPSRASAGPDPEGPDGKFGALVVTVCTEDGKAVPGAQVDIRHGDTLVARGTTDREGKFTVRPIHAGKFAVHAERRNLGAGRAPAVVKPETRNQVKVVLKKK